MSITMTKLTDEQLALLRNLKALQDAGLIYAGSTELECTRPPRQKQNARIDLLRHARWAADPASSSL